MYSCVYNWVYTYAFIGSINKNESKENKEKIIGKKRKAQKPTDIKEKVDSPGKGKFIYMLYLHMCII